MKIILYIIIAAQVVGMGAALYGNAKRSAVIAQHERTIKEQRAMIERLAQQEAIAIHITNEFRSNAVLGKVVVDANIKNVAEQVASILKGELNGNKMPLKQDINGH